MPTSSALDSAPRGEQRHRSRGRVVGLLLGWALLLAWLMLVGWNIATAGLHSPLSRLIALPSLPGLPLSPTLATQASASLLALMIALFLYLCALTFAPRPARAAKPALPKPSAPPAAGLQPLAVSSAASPAPAAESAPASEVAPGSIASGETNAGSRFTPWVFISHSSHDDVFGKRLAADLRAALAPGEPGRVWYDSAPERSEEDPDVASDAPDDPGGLRSGMNFPREIVDQIAARNVVVVILSPAAARSRWVKYEIDQAINRYNGPERFAIYPIIYRPCALPKPIAIFQALDFTHADVDAEDYQRQLNELVSRIAEGRAPLSESAPPFDLGLLPEPPRLIGRDDDLDWALSRLRVRETTAVTALRGMGGIGKSALAAVAIRRLRQERVFPDGIAVVLCENLRDPVIVLSQALARFAPGGRQPEADDLPGLAKAALALEGKRALIVLDNIEPGWPIEQVTGPLTAVGVTLLLTARQLLPDAVAPLAATRRLDLLAADDAMLLFAQNLGRDLSALTEKEREAAEAIVATLDRHTLAVRLAGAYAAYVASAYQRPLAQVAAEIAHDALGIPEGETQRKVEQTLARSIDALPDEARRLFAALAAFATGEFGQRAAQALARSLGLGNPDASVDLLVRRALLDASLDASLPATADAERLRLHPLLRAEAARRLVGWDDAQREQADRTLAAWYAGYSNAPPDLALTPDEANITGALDWALAHGDDLAAARICSGMRNFWRDTGRTQAGLYYLPLGAAAAGRIADQSGERGDRLRQANITLYLGDILGNTGRLPEAEAIYTQDLALRRAIEDRQGEGAVLSRLGQVALARGELAAAADYFQQSLPILRETEDRQGEGAVLSNLGQVALNRGQLEQAKGYFEQSLPIQRETQDRQGEGIVLSNLGQVALGRGDLNTAAGYFEQSLPIRRETQDRLGEGVDLATLGQIAEMRGQYAEAASMYREGIAALREVGDRINFATTLGILGRLLLQHSDDRAGGVAAYAEAIALWQAMGLADREQAAREEALALGCRADELPPPEGNAAG